MLNELILKQEDWRSMRRHVIRCAPLEACGLLAGKSNRVETVFPMHNAARSAVSFRLDPQEQWWGFQQIEAQGLELIGIYHSHPLGPSHPSSKDIAESMYPVVHIIWSSQEDKWQANGFWIEGQDVVSVSLQVVE